MSDPNEHVTPAGEDRYLCTAEAPATPERAAPFGGFTAHPDAREVGEQQDGYPGGDIVRYECPNCGARWTEELPQ